MQITLDEHGELLAASDQVMFVRETTPDGEATTTDHKHWRAVRTRGVVSQARTGTRVSRVAA